MKYENLKMYIFYNSASIPFQLAPYLCLWSAPNHPPPLQPPHPKSRTSQTISLCISIGMHSLPFSSPAFHVVQHHLSLGQHERDLNFPNIWAAFEHVKSSRPLKTMTNLGINHYISCHSCTQCILLENYSKICWLVEFNLKKKDHSKDI